MKKGLEVEVGCSDTKNLKFKNILKYEIKFPTKLLDFFNLLTYIKVFKQIKIIIKKNPRALFYLHTPVASHLFRICSFFKKLKIIYFVHGFRFMSASKPLKKYFFIIIERVLSLKTDLYITINN